MRILQINASVNSGSTGRIAEDIGKVMLANGHESFIAYGRGNRRSDSQLIKIGSDTDVYFHVLKTVVLDRHAFGSTSATKKLIQEIDRINPDVIGLHNLHGYYLNIEVLFNYLKSKNIPVLWTLFDCWAFTGHCSYFDNIDCKKWIIGCSHCPKKEFYPASYLLDNSTKNYEQKRELFNSLDNLQLVVHSQWLNSLVEQSFLKNIKTNVIASGIDLDVFKPTKSELRKKLHLGDKKIILGCASIWDKRKGLDDFKQLAALLSDEYQIILVGLNKTQLKQLDKRIIGFERTESVSQLAELYSIANVFVNPTYQDNFPTTNLEALACGTPVVTYNTGGSPEAIDELTGRVVEKGNITKLFDCILEVTSHEKSKYFDVCRQRAEKYFNKNDRYSDYLTIYTKMIEKL
jgi:glycosyltransferase involved in cell wall biosynthesis